MISHTRLIGESKVAFYRRTVSFKAGITRISYSPSKLNFKAYYRIIITAIIL